MKFDPPLISATLIRRYKRFLADVILQNGDEITVAVPNTGSMMGLTTPGSNVWLSTSPNKARKYPHTWEIVEADNTMVGVNTNLPNRLAIEAISNYSMIDNLHDYKTLKREQRYGEKSRIDILLEDETLGKAYIEVKNVHMMREQGLGEFPDSVTQRGARHLDELARMVKEGHRAIMVYIIQRADCHRFRLCADLDPNYGAAFVAAKNVGVEAFAIGCKIDVHSITPTKLLPIDEPRF